jgi:hypothetical protein
MKGSGGLPATEFLAAAFAATAIERRCHQIGLKVRRLDTWSTHGPSTPPGACGHPPKSIPIRHMARNSASISMDGGDAIVDRLTAVIFA